MTSSSAETPITVGSATGSSANGSAAGRRAQATVITRAEPSYDEQLKTRRRRYMLMMSMRIPFLILATALYQTPWLAMLVIAISIPLPWAAVLIANDRPARKPQTVIPGTINYERALPPGGREVVDSGFDGSRVDGSGVDGTVDADPADSPSARSYRAG